MMKCEVKVFSSEIEMGSPSNGQPYGGISVKMIDVEEVAEFVTSVGPERLISITAHSDSVTVWYWDTEPNWVTTTLPRQCDLLDLGKV